MGLETDANLARPFSLHRPRSVAEAVATLGELTASGDEVVVMSGGQSLTVMITSGLSTPDHVVSLAGCRDLPALALEAHRVTIGAATTVAEIAAHGELAQRCPSLVSAARLVGSPHVRAFGTVVGNVCHGDPGGDLTLPLLCCDAELLAVSSTGERVIRLADLVLGPYTTSLRPGEFGLSVGFTPPATPGQAYRKVMRRQGDLALASACAVVSRDGSRLGDVRLALGGLLGHAQRLSTLEETLIGTAWGAVPDLEAVRAGLVDTWSDLLHDPDDPGSAEYLKELAVSLVADVLARAMNGAT